MKITIEEFNATVVQLPEQARHSAWDGDTTGFVDTVRSALPAFALAAMGSRCPQEPVVVLTMDVPGIFATVGHAFQSHLVDEEPTVLAMDGTETLGDELIEHITTCWPNDVDETGRPVTWDEDYIPRPKVFSFLSNSIEHSYLLALTSIAERSGETWESLSELKVHVADWSIADLDKLKEKFPNEAAKDKNTPILFLHMQCAQGIVSCKSIPIREFLKQAIEFRMDAFPEALSTFPVATLWPNDIVNAHNYPIEESQLIKFNQ